MIFLVAPLLHQYLVLPVFCFSHSHKYLMRSHCFNLHFPNDALNGASFRMLIFPLPTLSGEVCVQFLCSFFNVEYLLYLYKNKNIIVYFGWQSFNRLPWPAAAWIGLERVTICKGENNKCDRGKTKIIKVEWPEGNLLSLRKGGRPRRLTASSSYWTAWEIGLQELMQCKLCQLYPIFMSTSQCLMIRKQHDPSTEISDCLKDIFKAHSSVAFIEPWGPLHTVLDLSLGLQPPVDHCLQELTLVSSTISLWIQVPMYGLPCSLLNHAVTFYKLPIAQICLLQRFSCCMRFVFSFPLLDSLLM